MFSKRSLVILLMIVILSACKENRPPQPFPYAQPPLMMATSSATMSEWLAEHYWNAWLDSIPKFSQDTSLIGGITKEDFVVAMKQYAALLNVIPTQKGIQIQNKLWSQLASCDESLKPIVNGLFQAHEQYFYHPLSSFRNEDFYLPAVRWKVSQETDSTRQQLYQNQFETCNHNQWGTVAPDFRYQVPGKEPERMHNIATPFTLLCFSIPECQYCWDIIQQLAHHADIQQAIQQGRLTVLNLYHENELEKWMNYRKEYPQTWINAFDPDQDIQNNRLYILRATPSLYLLNQNKQILLKDATPEQIVRAL